MVKNMRTFNLTVVILLLISQFGCRSGLSEVVLEVKETFRERVVYLEGYKTVTEEVWADQLPPGVKKISSRIVPKGTNVVLGREDYTETEKYPCGSSLPVPTRPAQPTKYCERNVTKSRNINQILPEDRERVTYETKRWEEADKSKARTSNGDETKEPSWNEPPVDNKTTRVGRRTDFYSVTLAATGGEAKTYNKQVSLEEWKTFQKGQKVKAIFWYADGQPLTITKMN